MSNDPPHDRQSAALSRRGLLLSSASVTAAALAGCEGLASAAQMDDVLVRNRSGNANVTVAVEIYDGNAVLLSESPTVDDGSAAAYADVWPATGEYEVSARRATGGEATTAVAVDSLDDTLWVTAVDDGSLSVELREA